MKKLQTITLGCSKNKVDTEHILSHLEDQYEIIPEGEDIPVDVYFSIPAVSSETQRRSLYRLFLRLLRERMPALRKRFTYSAVFHRDTVLSFQDSFLRLTAGSEPVSSIL